MSSTLLIRLWLLIVILFPTAYKLIKVKMGYSVIGGSTFNPSFLNREFETQLILSIVLISFWFILLHLLRKEPKPIP